MYTENHGYDSKRRKEEKSVQRKIRKEEIFVKFCSLSKNNIPIFFCDVTSMMQSEDVKDGHGNDTVGT